MKVLRFELPLLDLAGIGKDLGKGIVEHRHEGLSGLAVLGQMQREYFERANRGFTDGKAVAAVAFATRIQQQSVAFHPPLRHFQKSRGGSIHELELDLANPQTSLACGDFPLIKGDFDQGPVLSEQAPGAFDLDGKPFNQDNTFCGSDGIFEEAAGLATMMASWIEDGSTRSAKRDIMFNPLYCAAALRFECLDPGLIAGGASAAQAHREPCIGEVFLLGIDIDSAQIFDTRRSDCDGAEQRGQASGRYLELEFYLVRHFGEEDRMRGGYPQLAITLWGLPRAAYQAATI